MTDKSFIEHRTPKRWLRVCLTVATEMTDAVSAFLSNLTGTGVEIDTVKSDKSGTRERVTGYILIGKDGQDLDRKRSDLKGFLATLTENFSENVDPVVEFEEIEEEDWGRNWKKHFKTMRATQRIVIKPTWEKYDTNSTDQEPSEVVIEMDPGLAFGTGHHASTCLALNLIDELLTSEKDAFNKALDFGTGTGVLAMACALLGSKTVLAIDNDLDAVAAAQKNVTHNNLGEIVTVKDNNITSLHESYNLIVANIIHDVLLEMAQNLHRLLAVRGRLILAGILRNEQEKSIINIYSKLGCTHLRTVVEDEWVAILFGKDN